MIKILNLLLIIFSIHCRLNSEPPSVSFTFLIADLKHSEEEGIKICELQSGVFSAFRGYDWLVNEPGAVPKKVISMLQQFGQFVWVSPGVVQELAILNEMKNHEINFAPKIQELYQEKSFLTEAALPVEDPYDLASYPVLLIANRNYFKGKLESFNHDFPNVVVFDQALFPYFRDKNKMSQLFSGDPLLERIRPRWRLCERKMTIDEINQTPGYFSSEYVVIKPLHALLGRGIIFVERNKLPEILEFICHKPKKLSNHKDKGYQYWSNAKDTELIIEEFHYSDPVAVPHLGNKEYDPTLRIAFMVWHEHGEIHMDFIEEHWKLPYKALSEKGTFKDKHKSYEHIPYFELVEPERKAAIQQQLRETIPLIYAKMLGWE